MKRALSSSPPARPLRPCPCSTRTESFTTNGPRPPTSDSTSWSTCSRAPTSRSALRRPPKSTPSCTTDLSRTARRRAISSRASKRSCALVSAKVSSPLEPLDQPQAPQVRLLFSDDEQHYAFLIPIMKSLIDKCYNLLQMNVQVPNIPFNNISPTFYEDFKEYCKTDEWRIFVQKQVSRLEQLEPCQQEQAT